MEGWRSVYKLRKLAYISLVHSTMEYCGAIWDITVKEECDRLEIVKCRAAHWARGTKNIISVTALLKDLNWLPLADRRRHQRLCLFYKIINGKLQVPEYTVDIKRSKSRTRQSNSLTLVCESGRDKHSPYWKGTILRTIPEWNRLSDCTVVHILSCELGLFRNIPLRSFISEKSCSLSKNLHFHAKVLTKPLFTC